MAFGQPKRSVAARGYGADHVAARKAALSAYRPTDPCCLCGRPLGSNTRRIHLDHRPSGGGYRGLAHARCNIRDGARRGAAKVNARRRSKPMLTSRDW